MTCSWKAALVGACVVRGIYIHGGVASAKASACILFTYTELTAFESRKMKQRWKASASLQYTLSLTTNTLYSCG